MSWLSDRKWSLKIMLYRFKAQKVSQLCIVIYFHMIFLFIIYVLQCMESKHSCTFIHIKLYFIFWLFIWERRGVYTVAVILL